MIKIDVKKYDNFDEALKKFKAKVRKAKIIEDVNRKSHYISKSELRHRQKKKKTVKNIRLPSHG